jgi:KDO2-lipid IV(A) lauroyltransferase
MAEVTQPAEPRGVPGMTWEERRDLGLYRVMRSLPVSVVSRLGASLGHSLGRRAYPAADARVAAALKHLRSDLAGDPKALETAQRELWANVGRVYAEFCVFDKIVPEGRVTIDDPGIFDAVLADGRPVIMAYVHLGNWEASGSQVCQRAPGRVCAFAAPPPTNRVRAQIAAMQRARQPAKVVTTDRMGWRHALQHLESRGGIFYVAVDEVTEGHIAVPSFGRTLDTRGNLGKIVRIAARTGAIIVPIYSERLAGATFSTHILSPMEFMQRRDIHQDETLQHVAQLDALYAPAVLRLIDQWFGLLEYR